MHIGGVRMRENDGAAPLQIEMGRCTYGRG